MQQLALVRHRLSLTDPSPHGPCSPGPSPFDFLRLRFPYCVDGPSAELDPTEATYPIAPAATAAIVLKVDRRGVVRLRTSPCSRASSVNDDVSMFGMDAPNEDTSSTDDASRASDASWPNCSGVSPMVLTCGVATRFMPSGISQSPGTQPVRAGRFLYSNVVIMWG